MVMIIMVAMLMAAAAIVAMFVAMIMLGAVRFRLPAGVSRRVSPVRLGISLGASMMMGGHSARA
jgi:hypothetical protein